MKFIILACIAIIGFAEGSSVLSDVETEWVKFKEQHGKQYRSLNEETERKAIFSSNYEKIKEHNELYEQGATTFFLKINQKADMTTDEMKKLHGFKYDANARNLMKKVIFKPQQSISVPDSFDWRDKGVVTDIKDQAICGSCWAFSSTGSLEAQYFLKTGKLIPLSEQNLVDCSRNDDNNGCDGGDMIPAFKYIHKNDGIDSEKGYPYLSMRLFCRYSAKENVTSLNSYGSIEEGKEDELKAAVASIGPISIAMDASQFDFEFYGGGIYNNKKCKTKNDDLDHAVLAIGYGTDAGEDYWLIKNSWGAHWGIHGYFKLARNQNNACGVATAGCYPIMY